jgi:hypothetical protein
MRLSTRIAFLSLAAALAAPASHQLGAQLAAPANDSIPLSIVRDTTPAPASVEQQTSTGAPLTGLRAGVHARETARTMQPTFATNTNLGTSRALMVVGAAALITGAIIGGDVGTIFMVGGAVMGLYGLYQYLQ